MAGTFLIGEQKTRPGVYYRRERAGYTVEGATNGILACIFQSNWGPLNKEFDVDVTMMNDLEDYYGDGATIIREGLIGGATTVRCVRVGSEDGTCSSVMLKTVANGGTAGTNAVEILAKYQGNRSFTVSVRTNLITDKRQLQIYDGTKIFTSVEFKSGGDEAQSLVDAMANNRYFKARKFAAGVLADVTQAQLTGGTNPEVSTSSYDKGTNILERYSWNCIVADSDDSAVIGILNAFVKQSYETGHLGFSCVAGGTSSGDLDSKISLAASYNDEKVVYVLNGWIANDGTVYDGWQAAARIGGMIAGCETNVSLTHNVISDALELTVPLTNGEIIRAEQNGCLVLSTNANGQVWIDNAINTLVTENANMDAGWKKIRRTKTRFELMDRINRTHDRLVGNINNDENGRATVVAAAQRIINEMVGEGKLVFGSYVEEDPAHPAEGDSAWFKLHILDNDSMEKIYLTYVFRYNQTFDAA